MTKMQNEMETDWVNFIESSNLPMYLVLVASTMVIITLK